MRIILIYTVIRSQCSFHEISPSFGGKPLPVIFRPHQQQSPPPPLLIHPGQLLPLLLLSKTWIQEQSPVDFHFWPSSDVLIALLSTEESKIYSQVGSSQTQ